MMSAFTKSMKNAPTIGTTRNAFGAGPYRSTSAFMFAMAFAVATATGLFFGIYPASRASKLKPIDALLSILRSERVSRVFGRDGRLYAVRGTTGGGFHTGALYELDPQTGAIVRTLASTDDPAYQLEILERGKDW